MKGLSDAKAEYLRREVYMKFFFLVVFLVCFSQSAWARNPCSPWIKKDSITARKCQQQAKEAREETLRQLKEEQKKFQRDEKERTRDCQGGSLNMADIVSDVNKFLAIGTFEVDHDGLYVDSSVWEFLPLKDKETIARIFAVYQSCHIFKMDRWVPSIDVFDNRSGKKIGKTSMWSGRYKAE